jgi:carboxypeptidase-like protein/TonB-dependent receptor-like protein
LSLNSSLILKTLLLLILFVVQVNDICAQTKGKLRGFVTDNSTGEALPFGNVFIEELNTGSSTDENGYFFISAIPSDKSYTVIVTYVGYETKEIEVYIAPGKITETNFELISAGIELQQIEKVGQKEIEKNATDIGLERISVKKLETLPKGVEADVFRTLQYTAGVSFVGDVSARYYVRGGAGNQNLVLLNGITVYNPFHAMGLFSVIDPDMINSVEFYKGGFPEECGGRLSSVMDIISKDGNRNRFSGKATASYLTGKVLLEGPLPTGSFMVTARKSYNNDILKKFLNEQSIPIDFYDASFKINFENPIIPNGKFSFFGFISKDKLNNNDPFREDFNWTNNIFGFKWTQVYDSPLYSTLVISNSSFRGEVVQNFSSAKPRLNELNDFTLDMSFNYIFDSRDEIALGLIIKTINSKLYTENKQGAATDIDEFGGSINFYTKYKFLRFDKFGADIGARMNTASFSAGGEFTIEPRILLTYNILPQLTLKGTYGVFLQEITTVTDEREVVSLFEPWIITPDYIEPAKSTQYAMGVDYYFTESLKLKIEGYYKEIENLSAINETKEVSSDPDLIVGSGESYGWEFQVNYDRLPFSISSSYTLSWSYKEIENWLYYPRYDNRHSFNISFEYNFGNGWSASTVWNYSSGLPTTELIGFYDRLLFGDFDNPASNNFTIEPFPILGDRNIARLPDYHRLDISLTKQLKLFYIDVDIALSIINVYDRANLFYFERQNNRRVNMLPFMPTATIKISI